MSSGPSPPAPPTGIPARCCHLAEARLASPLRPGPLDLLIRQSVCESVLPPASTLTPRPTALSLTTEASEAQEGQTQGPQWRGKDLASFASGGPSSPQAPLQCSSGAFPQGAAIVCSLL